MLSDYQNRASFIKNGNQPTKVRKICHRKMVLKISQRYSFENEALCILWQREPFRLSY